ncbi:unnamed protein product (macronuclear) [Paramecium tetraurelia]|uniref:Uncharacterized protein n=1 Tax=Paramecium tetraurelia TaxID=5888 RepID=A0C9Z7_PARTE|nr:uncharacterized protein GSPATT00006921001 [Paramecium tetraurelia]CAK67614.1 unnamed protein product [Paramecium tetraurelia]|eukprot:XP_001435011.1 hypothetical protein (macronuclear) [Paramecium tetraurelia strain d4-2]
MNMRFLPSKQLLIKLNFQCRKATQTAKFQSINKIMNQLLSLLQLIFFIAQSQESGKNIYTGFSGQNWDISGWYIFNPYKDLNYDPYDYPFSQCNGTKLFGGYCVFGVDSLISSKFELPPHYSIRISLDLWNWDGETFQIVLDSETEQKPFFLWEGQQMCGNQGEIFLEFNTPMIITLPKHCLLNLDVIMTSTLNQLAYDESWGFQNFIIEILECPQDCIFCTDLTSSCYFWRSVKSYLPDLKPEEGWESDNQIIMASECLGIKIYGGTNLLKGKRIDKILETQIPHFKVQILIKLWTFGVWDNESFSLLIDDKLRYIKKMQSDKFVLKPYYLLETKITNVDVDQFHSSPKIKLSMITENNRHDLAYWGFESIDVFVGICSIGCQECTGELDSECVICLNKWINVDIGCIGIDLIYQISPSFRMCLS